MKNPWLCLINIGALAAGALLMSGGLIWISASGREAPAALWAMASALWGALSSFLVSPPRGSVGVGDTPKSDPGARP